MLAFAQILAVHEPDALERLGFYEPRQQLLLAHVAVELGGIGDPDLAVLAENLLRRIRELSPEHHGLARTTLMKLQSKPADEHWWVPQDIDAPPSTEPLTRRQISFSREDVDRVLADL